MWKGLLKRELSSGGHQLVLVLEVDIIEGTKMCMKGCMMEDNILQW